ncbi:MAG: GDSL-type esterase/lipase family protein [Oscillospiraceae bacterium]|nr:GDSL-type esterase/lipase family protein [Oscillospiraceae bacterium]
MNFKKLISSGIAAVMCTSVIFSLPVSSKTYAAETNDIVVFGDSIATGNNGKTFDFPSLAAKAIDNGNLLGNYAKNGSTSEEVLDVIKTKESSIKEAETVVVSAGANDYLKEILSIVSEYMDEGDSIETMTKEKLEALKEKLQADKANLVSKLSRVNAVTDVAYGNVKSIADEIKTINPDAEIYILNLYNPFETASEYDEVGTMINNLAYTVIDTFNTKLRLIKNASVVQVAAAFEGNTKVYMGIDQRDVHPSNAGQIKIASLLTSSVNQEEETISRGKILSTLTPAQLNALPDLIKEGAVMPDTEPEITTTTAATTTASSVTTVATTTTAATESSAATTSSQTTASSVTTTTTNTQSGAQTTTTSAATTNSTTSTSVSKINSAPATSDRGVSAFAVTGLLTAACAVLAARKRND